MKLKLLTILIICSIFVACQSNIAENSSNNISSNSLMSIPNSDVTEEPESEPTPIDENNWIEKPILGTRTFVATSVAIVREKPDPASPEILSIEKGMEINAVAITDNDYYKLDDGTFVKASLFAKKTLSTTSDNADSSSSKNNLPPSTSFPTPTEHISLDEKFKEIVDEYTAKIIAATPQAINEYNSEALNNTEGTLGLYVIVGNKIDILAKICNEGSMKISEISFSFGSGQYDEYGAWIDKLKIVYMKEASKIQDADKIFQQSVNYYGEFSE